EALRVELSFAGDAKVGLAKTIVEPGCLDDDLDARTKRGAKEDEHAEAQPAGGAGAGGAGLLLAADALDEPVQACFERFDLFGSRPFLRPEDPRRAVDAKQRIAHVAGDNELDTAHIEP